MKILLSTLLLLISFHSSANTLTVMQYNTENTFDTRHDEKTDDYTYLPLQVKHRIPGFNAICQGLNSHHYIQQCLNLDWTDSKLAKKIMNLSRVIRSFDQTGKGPDIIVLQEIENKNVLNELVSRGLRGLGYRYQVLIEGDDSRGIDVAVVSRVPVVGAQRHPLVMNGQTLNTRGILEVALRAGNRTIIVYANHWPSQGNPTAERIASAKLLSSIADSRQADLIVALGDFNTLLNESPSPFRYLSNFIDAEKEARRVLPDLNPGTHFYRGQWSSLDKIFVHRRSRVKAHYEKFQIVNRPFMMIRDSRAGGMIPNRFNFDRAEGFSDHLPLGLEFSL